MRRFPHHKFHPPLRPVPFLLALLLAQFLALLPAAIALAGDLETDLACLALAYPGLITGVEREGSTILLTTSAATRLVYDDGREKSPEEALEHPTVKDMLAQIYPLGREGMNPSEHFHPGRRRVAAFFALAYGASPAEVKAASVSVPFAGKRLRFNENHGAAAALAKAGEELASLLQSRPDLRKYVKNSSTIAWRTIAGTNRLSMHSLGIAVDLNPKLGPYWGWEAAGTPNPAPGYPYEIVEIFENNGFVWGGKWAEFDLMHFEYRPELICKAKAVAVAGIGRGKE